MASMKIPNDYMAIELIVGRLEEILREPCQDVTLEQNVGEFRHDAVVSVGDHIFVVEWKRSGVLGQIALAVNQLVRVAQEGDSRVIPLLAVPYMGVKGRYYCEQAGVSWLDLSGNSGITAKGLHVREQGFRNRYHRREPLGNPFGSKGSRIARWLLAHPGGIFRQQELATAVELSEGYVSRVIGKLFENQLVTRESKGIRVLDHNLMLDSWDDSYRFNSHALIPGHIPTRSGVELVQRLAGALNGSDIQYAMTGLAAAWLYTRYAEFRLLTVYLSEFPSAELINRLEFREEPRGANVWLVVPNDEGVFQVNQTIGAVRCVHPVQAYLDLQEHPERSREAADELRSRLLIWSSNDG